ncbi:hypothetical protein Taro_022881 [Colocasia esculenta]|uniref:Uncharacterized protein n=1 Tax=Colocasia esculenta TaxID=4460 RepID=A0A843VCR3_COLES|nr:hypothetical protein [Colocasia esculenta]
MPLTLSQRPETAAKILWTEQLERSEAPVPWPAEEQEDENPHLCPSEEKATRPLSHSRRRLSLCRVQEKGKRHCICRFVRYPFYFTFLFHGSQPSTSTSTSALLVWVRRRHPARRHRGSDAFCVAIRRRRGLCRNQEGDWTIVAIRIPPRRRSLSRPHTPCVRLEHSLEGLRKSPLTVDSHTVAGLVVPVAT